MTDGQLAHDIATEAGELLVALRTRGGCEGHVLGDRGDREANDLILARLRAARPDDFILSEESLDDPRRCGASRVWIVDPLDGTREYSAGRDDWAVHVALAVDGRPRDGAVAIPAQGLTFATDRPYPQPALTPGPLCLLASRSRTPDLARRVATLLGAELVTMGSAGAKAMAVVDGRAAIYLHEGGQYEWDNCAPAAVAQAAGLHASRIDGAPLVYNCADPLLPDLLICRPEWTGAVLDAVRAAKG